MTNLHKEKEDIIYELLLSLNNRNSSYVDERVKLAIAQYDSLVENKIITEWCEHDWMSDGLVYNQQTNLYEHRFVCSKCRELRIEQTPF